MKTTLTLEEDIANFLKEQARLLDKPFEQVVNDTLRRGMSQTLDPTERPRFRVRPHPGKLNPDIDPLRLNQLNDELEIEEYFRKDEKYRRENEEYLRKNIE